MMKAPNERARLYFLLAWFHAIVQERLRYSPLGWAKYYEFNESDLRVACDTLDTWIEATAMVLTYNFCNILNCTFLFSGKNKFAPRESSMGCSGHTSITIYLWR